MPPLTFGVSPMTWAGRATDAAACLVAEIGAEGGRIAERALVAGHPGSLGDEAPPHRWIDSAVEQC
ncbi:hypothetical protein AS96_04785 [Microbacterium sp. MRS-1]|nr:hypothetical protein AS96_04785 [Microbacterium sp. MRS-1]ODT23026.1 MAG: hypothetical protein ABS64_11225 [Microbacterium sp. SCN 69-37]